MQQLEYQWTLTERIKTEERNIFKELEKFKTCSIKLGKSSKMQKN